MMITSSLIDRLLNCNEPWTRYRTCIDLLGMPETEPQVASARASLLAHPQVQALVEAVRTWPGRVLKRHNDASHPLYALSVLADFGLRRGDPGMTEAIDAVLAHQSSQGAFQTLVNIPKAFGGNDTDQWAWMLCDAPTLLYVLLAAGLQEDERVQLAAQHLSGLWRENGYPCAAAHELGGFRGPGRKTDPCPIANVYALKALSLLPNPMSHSAAHAASQAILCHWEQRETKKPYLFGIGTDFRKLKYPFVWYDILHVVDALSRFAFIQNDTRFIEMLQTITCQADEQGCYTAGSMYQAWKGWSFADKKYPSPWLTLLVLRIEQRVSAQKMNSAWPPTL